MKICIIGAGVAGLQTANILSAEGHDCHIYEKKPSAGGVWLQNYDGYSLQVPSELYEFCGMKKVELDNTFPTGSEVCDTIQEFIRTNALEEKCKFKFNTTVLKITRVREEWSVESYDDIEHHSSYDNFDFCIVCTGMYSIPKIPDEFQKFQPLHSSEFLDASICKDKHVIVVGAGKSAIDCAVEAQKYASKVELVMRDCHWPVPRYILGFIPFKWGTYSRLGHALLPEHWNLNEDEVTLHKILSPFKFAIWKCLEFLFAIQFKLKKKPHKPLVQDLFNGGQILTYEFRNCVANGSISQIITPHIYDYVEQNFKESTLIVCGTGFKKDYEIFDEDVHEKLDLCNDGLWLYKNIIPVGIPDIAFIGSEVSTFNNILTHNIQAQWLCHNLKNGFETNENMQEYIEKDKEWKRKWMPFSSSRASLIQLHMTKYHDILMQDMNKPLVKNRWWDWIVPITARDFWPNKYERME